LPVRARGPMSRADVQIKTKDGACRAAVFRPASGAGPWPAVIFYMDGVAIRPTLYDMCQRLADIGYLVLLPDMFYRVGPYEPFDGKTLFNDPVQRDRLMTMVRSATNKQLATEDTRSFLDYLDSLPDVKGKKVGATGYCMGGGIALTVAAAYPDRFVAVASFHGGNLATDEPDSPHRNFDRIKARVLIVGADQDQHYLPEQEARVKAALGVAHVEYRAEIWSGAQHGWTMADLPVYNREAAERHIDELRNLFGATLKG
jgi:carboxymethylenebutenolidase